MKVSVKTPATIANLGCGFDSFGLALPLYNIVSVEETVLPGSGIEINIINIIILFILQFNHVIIWS